MKFTIDTGAQVNVMCETTWKQLADGELKSPNKKLFAYGPDGLRKELPIIGRVECSVSSQVTGRETHTEFHIIRGSADNLLSCKTSEDLNLICFANNVSEEIREQYKDRFQGIGKMKDTSVKLHINQEVAPITQKARRIPFHVRAQVEEELDRLEHDDIIEMAQGPTTWVSPIVVVHKTQGVRLCLDSRAINTAISREQHAIPTIEDLIHDLTGAKIFSKIDLNKGYHQLELDEESRSITTFATHKGYIDIHDCVLASTQQQRSFKKKCQTC